MILKMKKGVILIAPFFVIFLIAFVVKFQDTRYVFQDNFWMITS